MTPEQVTEMLGYLNRIATSLEMAFGTETKPGEVTRIATSLEVAFGNDDESGAVSEALGELAGELAGVGTSGNPLIVGVLES